MVNRMSSLSWSEHVKKYREEHQCTYKEALQKASETYVKKTKARKPRPKKEMPDQPVLEVSRSSTEGISVPVHEPVEQPVQPPPESDESVIKSLKRYKKAELIAMCDTLGLDTKGTVKQMSERITKSFKNNIVVE